MTAVRWFSCPRARSHPPTPLTFSPSGIFHPRTQSTDATEHSAPYLLVVAAHCAKWFSLPRRTFARLLSQTRAKSRPLSMSPLQSTHTYMVSCLLDDLPRSRPLSSPSPRICSRRTRTTSSHSAARTSTHVTLPSATFSWTASSRASRLRMLMRLFITRNCYGSWCDRNSMSRHPSSEPACGGQACECGPRARGTALCSRAYQLHR